MKGDFSRLLANDTYIMTLMQQGRVQLDSDWNAQVIQQWMYLKAMTATILGEHGGPADPAPDGGCEVSRGHFKIMESLESSELDFSICEGRYFVDGDMCVNSDDCTYLSQPYLKSPAALNTVLSENDAIGLVYLKVWLRHLTYIEDPVIREVALGGPDTTTRVQRVWQVIVADRAEKRPSQEGELLPIIDWADLIKEDFGEFQRILPADEKLPSGRLMAEVAKQEEIDDPCVLPPEAGYRGVENQLYRVEILYSGDANDPDDTGNQEGDTPPEGQAVFVWSRDNGSVVYPIENPKSEVITLKNLWRDERYAIHVGDWVEISDEISVLHRTSLPLRRVVAVDTELMQITLTKAPFWGDRNFADLPLENPTVRRWDHAGDPAWGGGLPVIESTEDKPHPIELEKGIFITFWKNEDSPYDEDQDGAPDYRYGKNDWWLIPARTATGDIEWPPSEEDPDKPKKCGPMRDGCWYAPLALIEKNDDGEITDTEIYDTRRQFIKMWHGSNGL